MVGQVIGCLCCILCALPFYYIAFYGKNSHDSIAFWSGDDSLKIKNIEKYNLKMSLLYRNYAHSYVFIAIMLFLIPQVAVVLLLLDCTLGLFIVWKCYKKYVCAYQYHIIEENVKEK